MWKPKLFRVVFSSKGRIKEVLLESDRECEGGILEIESGIIFFFVRAEDGFEAIYLARKKFKEYQRRKMGWK